MQSNSWNSNVQNDGISTNSKSRHKTIWKNTAPKVGKTFYWETERVLPSLKFKENPYLGVQTSSPGFKLEEASIGSKMYCSRETTSGFDWKLKKHFNPFSPRSVSILSKHLKYLALCSYERTTLIRGEGVFIKLGCFCTWL